MQLRLYYADGGNHPVLGRVYHQCQEFIDGRDVARYQRYLANTLSCIAQSVDDCDRVLAEIVMVEEGGKIESEIEGNDVDVLISRDSVQVDINVNDEWIGQPEGRFSLSEFKAVVSAWREFLQMPESLSSEVIIDL